MLNMSQTVHSGYTSNCVTFNPLKAELIYIMHKNLSYLTENTVRFNYKDQPVSAVQGSNPCLL